MPSWIASKYLCRPSFQFDPSPRDRSQIGKGKCHPSYYKADLRRRKRREVGGEEGREGRGRGGRGEGDEEEFALLIKRKEAAAFSFSLERVSLWGKNELESFL